MNITEWKLTITCEDNEKSLIYRGNEHIVIKNKLLNANDDNGVVILFPRHVLRKFMEMIDES